MPVLTRSALSASPLADLHLIAGELGLDGYRRLRKAELVDRILERQGGAPAADADTAAADEAPATKRRGRRRRRDADAGSEQAPDDVASADDADLAAPVEDAPEDAADAEPARRERAPRDRTPRDRAPRDRSAQTDNGSKADSPEAAERTVEGVVTLQSGGSGLVTAEDGGDDVYVSAAQVRRCELVDGDRVSGPVRPARRSERHPSLARVEQINGRPADEVSEGTPYDTLECAYPTARLALASPELKAVADAAPFGRGSRVTITGAALSGKTELLQKIAAELVAADGVEVLTVLAGSRPEEAGSWKTAQLELQANVALPAPPEARARAIEGAIDAGRRMATRGQDVAIVIDTLEGLDRGVVRRALGAARNLTDSGSLTVIATAAAPIGGETTVIALDRAQAAAGQFPALDLQASGTVRADLLS